MTAWTLVMVAATVLLDVCGQIFFKLGLARPHLADLSGKRAFWIRVAMEPRILGGIDIYAVEFFLWFAVLSRLDLSLAVPLASLGYSGVLVASRFIIGETVPLDRKSVV